MPVAEVIRPGRAQHVVGRRHHLLIQSPRVPTNGDAGNSSENKRKHAKKIEVISKKKKKKGGATIERRIRSYDVPEISSAIF